MEKDAPDWRKQLEKGNFAPTKQWLIKNVHSQGNLYDPPALIKKITGKELAVKPYLDYLNGKYSKLYGF
jgi:carboxypeptidase Taq